MAVQFADVSAAALAQAAILLPQWMGGKRQGHEWVGERKANGGIGDSWSVNLNTGEWGAFSSGQFGTDLVSLYAALNHLNQVAALEQVAALVGVTDRHVRVLPAVKPPEPPAEPIPEDGSDPAPHYEHGEPQATYRYGNAFVVCRYKTKRGKLFIPWTWRAGGWHAKAYDAPRPLYRLAELAARPSDPVLVVEGEKCADVAAAHLLGYVPISWANGANAVKHNDWTPLKGRDVLIWPDADEPGAKAAAQIATLLAPLAERVRIINPTDQAKGWDIADAIEEGWDAQRIAKWAGEHIRDVAAKPLATTPAPSPIVEGEPGESIPVGWRQLGLDTNEGGMPHPTLANASQILQMHPSFKGRIWLDSFRGKIYHTLRGAVAQAWTDADSRRVTAHIQQQFRLPKLGLNLMQDAIAHAAECHPRNSLTDWLDSLEWDGEARLATWLADCLGVEHTPYSMAIAKNWPISMVARAYVPGCKVDTMPVLEGAQGISKSTFLEILGTPWFSALPMAFGDKDFLQAIQGRWLIEIPDMTGFSRREHSHVLATMAIRSDVYRASYGRFTEDHPRVAVFAATSETSDYLQDTRGRRRYWPLRCTAIDLDALRAQREQLFAEAVCAYREGERWYEMPMAETDSEQLARSRSDLWTDRVLEYVSTIWDQQKLSTRTLPITSPRILTEAIEVPLAKQTDIEQKRIASILREAGWVQVRDAHGRRWKKVERRDDAYEKAPT